MLGNGFLFQKENSSAQSLEEATPVRYRAPGIWGPWCSLAGPSYAQGCGGCGGGEAEPLEGPQALDLATLAGLLPPQ